MVLLHARRPTYDLKTESNSHAEIIGLMQTCCVLGWSLSLMFLPDFVHRSHYTHYWGMHAAWHLQVHGTFGVFSQSGHEVAGKGALKSYNKSTSKFDIPQLISL